MKLLVIKIDTSQEAEDALTVFSQDNLQALGSEARRRSDFERAGWQHDSSLVNMNQIKDLPTDTYFYAYFDQEKDPDLLTSAYQRKLRQLRSYGLKIGLGVVSYSYIEDQDWNTAWKKFYHVIEFSRALALVPKWEKYRPHFKDQKVLKLDPGLAFGTGNHITTQLALMALERTLNKPLSVIDIGTGSGILAIAAHLLGAKKVDATDISEEALTAAKSNATLNKISDIQLLKTNLLAGVSGKFDVIIANILAEILLDLIPQINSHLKDNGRVIFSGIDYLQLSKIKHKLAAYQLQVDLEMREKRWVGLIVSRKSD